MHHRWSVALLAFLGLFVGYTTYVGDPIHCWCPAEFTDSHCNYTESYCWIMDTYYLPQDDAIPSDPLERQTKQIKYYQWVPTILFVLALCYKLPNLLWDGLNTATGLNLGLMIQGYEVAPIGKERDTSVQDTFSSFSRWLKRSRVHEAGDLHVILSKMALCLCFILGRKRGTYLTGLYLFIKLFYIAVSAGVFYLLNRFLAMNYMLYGVEVISHLVTQSDIEESPRFPRVTLCDIEIRQLQNIQTYTVQCVLSINLFNEKIFAFIWFWIAGILLVGVFSYVQWLVRILVRSNRQEWVAKYIRRQSTETSEEIESYIVKFTETYLGMDGVFALRILEFNTSEMMVFELMELLKADWDNDGIHA